MPGCKEEPRQEASCSSLHLTCCVTVRPSLGPGLSVKWAGPPCSEVCVFHNEHGFHFWKKLASLKENRLRAYETTSEKMTKCAPIHFMDNSSLSFLLCEMKKVRIIYTRQVGSNYHASGSVTSALHFSFNPYSHSLHEVDTLLIPL